MFFFLVFEKIDFFFTIPQKVKGFSAGKSVNIYIQASTHICDCTRKFQQIIMLQIKKMNIIK